MNEQEKIVELKIRGKISDQPQRVLEENWVPSDRDALSLLTEALKSLKKLETGCEIDHGSLTVRDEICVLRYYLQTLQRYIESSRQGR